MRLPDDIFGPAEASGGLLKPVFGGENAVAAAGCNLTQEISFLSEQPEAVLHLPGDVKIAGARQLRKRRVERRERDQDGDNDCKTHGLRSGKNVQFYHLGCGGNMGWA
jgi:hypothetical protein